MAALEKTGMTQEAGQAGRAGPAVPSESAGTAAPEHGAPGWRRRLGAALEELWIALLGWIPTPVGLALRLAGWRWLFARCGSVRFSTGLSLAGCRGMCLGSNVRLGRGCFITATDGELVLHDNVALSPYVHVGADAGRIEIGAHTAVGPGTVIRAANHCIARQDVPMMHQGHVPGEIIIEEDVWIGANCVITPDVRIGRGAVVGAGAVVTRNVAPFSIVGGVPARVIGMRGQSGQPVGGQIA
nr:acyltransferase [uncultured Desulfovibrio sp.]